MLNFVYSIIYIGEDDQYLDWHVVLVFLFSSRLPEDGTPVLTTCRILILVTNCILMSAFIG